MSITKVLTSRAALFLGAICLVTAVLFAASPQARADVVFLTRIGHVMTTYPRTDAMNIGTTTAPTQVATSTSGVGKLGVNLGPDDSFLRTLDGWRKAFAIASTTTVGGTATTTDDILVVRDTGCIQAIATSSSTGRPTLIHLIFSTIATTSSFGSANGYTLWGYGACP